MHRDLCMVLTILWTSATIRTRQFVCCLWSYQDGYRLVTVHIWGLYSVCQLRNQTTSTMTWYPTQSHYTDNQSLPYVNNTEHLDRKRHVSVLKSLVWLDQGSNPWVRILQATKVRDRQSIHLAILSGHLHLDKMHAYCKVTHVCALHDI